MTREGERGRVRQEDRGGKIEKKGKRVPHESEKREIIIREHKFELEIGNWKGIGIGEGKSGKNKSIEAERAPSQRQGRGQRVTANKPHVPAPRHRAIAPPHHRPRGDGAGEHKQGGDRSGNTSRRLAALCTRQRLLVGNTEPENEKSADRSRKREWETTC